MNGRVYDPGMGRFLSVDPVIQSPGNSQSLNPYSYIMNNPLAGTDPTGYTACGEGPQSCVGEFAPSFNFDTDKPKHDTRSVCLTQTNCKQVDYDKMRRDAAKQDKKNTATTGGQAKREQQNTTTSSNTETPVDVAKEVLTQNPIPGAKINKKDSSTSTANGEFDPDGLRKLRGNGKDHHDGVDLGADEGTEVKSAGDGKVYFVKKIYAYGKVVYVKHENDVITRYSHLSSQDVKKGDKVKAGDVIGKVGRSGNVPKTAKSHLHYEVLVNWKRIDPAKVHDYEVEK